MMTTGTGNDKNNQRKYSLVGETIYVVVVAEFTGSNKAEAEISAWKNDIQSCCVLTTVTDELSPSVASRKAGSNLHISVEDGDSKPKGEAGKLRPCPIQILHKVDETDPLKQVQLHTWQELEETKLAVTCSVVISSPPCTDKCTVWAAICTAKRNGQECRNQSSLATYLLYHSKGGLEVDVKSVRWIVHAALPVIKPPVLQCRHVAIGGKQNLFINVSNRHATKLTVHSVRVSSTLKPPAVGQKLNSQPDLTSEVVECNEPIKVEIQSGDLPISLVSMETHTVVMVMQVKDTAEIITCNINNTKTAHMEATLCWSLASSHGNQCSHAVTNYSLLRLKIRKPGLIVVAEPESQPTLKKSFNMKYTISNNLADFLTLNLVWNPEKALNDARAQVSESYRRGLQDVINSVVCHEPARKLGSCSFGSTTSVSLAFQILNPGVYELGQHMKLNLQYSVPSQKSGERRDSITSTHSMPSDLLTPGQGHGDGVTTKSSSMCPLSAEDGKDWRHGSTVSLRSLSAIPTPTDLSPLHVASGVAHKHSTGDVRSVSPNTGLLVAQKLMKLAPPEDGSTRPCMAPVHPTAITTQHVLKRNCQVFVVD